MAPAGRLWRRALTEFSGISGVMDRWFPSPSVDKRLPLAEKGVYPFYTCRWLLRRQVDLYTWSSPESV
jgi:hypothetical protein